MIPVLLSTAYLPLVSWMAVITQYNDITIEIHETYPKQTFRNRCNIATSSGVLSLSVPVIRVNGNHTKTADIEIDNSINWQTLHWRSIVTAYNKSPYFFYYRDLFEPIYKKKFHYLIDLNQELLDILLATLQIRNANIHFTPEYEFIPEAIDLRSSFQSKKTPCQSIIPALPRYMQAFEENHGFIPDLSIIDLLFNLGPDAVKYMSDLRIILPE